MTLVCDAKTLEKYCRTLESVAESCFLECARLEVSLVSSSEVQKSRKTYEYVSLLT